MKITSSAGEDLKSSSDTICPSTFRNLNAGAFVPSGNIVLGVRAMRLNSFQNVTLADQSYFGSMNSSNPAHRNNCRRDLACARPADRLFQPDHSIALPNEHFIRTTCDRLSRPRKNFANRFG